ncbi:MAG TPA: 5-formyltetrahydrofolate cyclo-ligase [Steroidobacteraceae bacterium]|nr:5-formyltetrahydrofolate cyclo-ligase [Steroidobacteraceae bacterium]
MTEERAQILRWRKAERERLIAARLATPAEDRRRFSALIETHLHRAVGNVQGVTVSAYSPFRGEPVLRDLLQSILARGGRTALPVVVAPGKPLLFRLWSPGDPTERGVWDIPVPSSRAAVVVPDVVIAPVVGFDPACYRLGYGGGFFDRTLASLARRPRAFGIGYSQAALSTIHPLEHDIAMDAIVTEDGVLTRPALSAS